MNLFDFAEGKKDFSLLPIQSDFLVRGRAMYTGNVRRVIWQAPCGSGKTVVASEQTRMALSRGRKVLHVVHRRRLVDQMVSTLNRFGIYASPLMEGRMRWGSNVYCASRDTLLSMLKDGQQLPMVDLVIPDECHTAATQVLDWYLQNCPNAYWAGYTATPVRADGSSMSPPWQALVCMATTSQMIAAGRLCPVKVYNPDAIGKRRRKGDKVKPVGDPIDHWKKYANGLPTVVFAASVSDSLAITQRYNEAGITAEHIDASTDDAERDAVFERSKSGQTKVISNCGVLIEGVDLPWLTCCQILRGCNSLILWCQSTGRVMRTHPGKEFGIVLDHAGAAHEFGLPDSDFEWTLDDEKTVARNNKPPKDRAPVSCPACGAVFSGKPACPECGKVLPKKQRKSLMDGIRPGDGLLTEFNGQQDGHVRQDALERLWKKILHIGKNKGWDMRRCAAVFSREAKCPPWEAGLDCPLPRGGAEWSTSVKDWLAAH